jgi:ubiquinone biosynthesis protein COQ4
MKDDPGPLETESPRLIRALNEIETSYMQGGMKPATSSILTSNSKYLNSPLFREALTQMALRRYGEDLPDTYCIPHMMRGLADVTDVDEYVAEVAAEKTRNPEFRDFVNARRLTSYLPGKMDQYETGTLGAEIRNFIEQSGMNMEFTGIGDDIRSDLDYLLKRRGVTHDIEHMVSGFGPNALGEVALAMCNNASFAKYFPPKLAHYTSATTIFVTVASYMRNSLHYPALMPHLFEAMRRGIAAGQALEKPLFMVPWEDYLDWQLDDLRAELGLEAGPPEWAELNHLGHG